MPAATSNSSMREKIGSYPISAALSVNNHTPPATGRPKQRNSILVAASDALSFSLRRSKRPTIQHAHSQRQRSPVIDEVLEISAEAAQKDGVAERVRLRAAAAQAVGLAGTTSSDLTTVAASTRDDISIMSSAARSAKRTTIMSIPQQSSQANQNISALPSYPATLNSLQPFVQHSSALFKYYPSQSAFLRLQRSRQWKHRHLVLTSLRCPSESDSSTGTGDNTTQAQLHLFKSSNGDEKEIERLGINQDSVIYVADGGFGGNKEFVVKVAGFLHGEVPPPSPSNSPSSTPTVWLLQLPDLVHMQRWIQFIKSSVLTQRAEKAGLGSHFYNNTYNGSGPELKGDLDLMISMGKQGLLPGTPQLSTFEGGTLTSRDRDKAGEDSNPSVRSRQSIAANASSSSNSAVSALRGLFNGRPVSRQLSSSRTSIGLPSQPSGSTTQEDSQSAEEPGQTTRHDTFMRTFRPTSPPVASHATSLSPPLSPSHSLTTGESTSLNPASPTMSSHPPISGARHYLPGGSGTSSRSVTHSNNFSVDWDAIDTSSQIPCGTHDRRISSASMALTPPPRNRRPWTTNTIPSGSRSNWLAREREKKSSVEPAGMNLDSERPLEHKNHLLDAQGSPRVVSERIAEGAPEDFSLQEPNGDDDTTNDTVRANSFPAPIPHIPSPIVTPASLLHSSASSFAGGASNYNQSNRHSIHSGRNSILSERSPRPPSHASLASYDTDAQHPVQHPIKEVSESDPLPSAGLGGPSPISLLDHERTHGSDVQTQTEEVTERPNSFGCDPPSDVEKVNSARLRLGTLPKPTPPPSGPPPAVPAFDISVSSLRSPSPTPENASGHHSHDRPPTPTSTVTSVGDSLTGRYPQPPSLNGYAHPHSKRMSTISSTSARSGWSATSGSTNTEQSKGSFGVPTGGSICHTAPRALKISNGSMSSQGPGGSLVHGSGNRTSILPPQRPIPSAALPSPPIGEVHERRQSYFSNRSIAFSATDSVSGSPRGPEFTLRSSRMSMAPPAPPLGALPPRPDEVSRLSMSSFGSGTNPLHAILASPPTGTASLHHGIVPPPTTSPPMRPLPPTPEVFPDRSQSPTLSVHSAHSAHSNRSIGSLGKLPSLRLRLRMMTPSPSPAPPAAGSGREGALPEPRRSQQLARLPPAPPPPTSPPPSTPSLPPTSILGYRGHDRTDSNASYGHSLANRIPMSTVAPSPIGEAITSRLEQYPLSSILPMSPSPLYPSRQTSPPPMSYVRPLPQFPLQQPSPYERHSLSPPPRRNSRASQYPPPSDRDRERTDSLPRRQRPVPEEPPTGGRVVQMKHSAINLAGEAGGPFSSNL